MADVTSKHALPFPEGSDLISTLDGTVEDLAEAIDAIMAVADSGIFSARPVSTPGSPGKFGRFYFATDTERLYLDIGTAWAEIVLERSPEANFRTVRGILNASAGILEGDGFSAVEGSAGFYTVTFDDAFSGIPNVHIQQVGLAGEVALDSMPTVNGFDAVADASALTASWMFWAVGSA